MEISEISVTRSMNGTPISERDLAALGLSNETLEYLFSSVIQRIKDTSEVSKAG